MRPRKKKNLVPRLEAVEALMLRQGDAGFPLSGAPLYLEIGCGKGAFIAALAAQNADSRFIAVEREPHVAVMAMERCAREDIRNVRFIICDAGVLADMLPERSLSGIYINFCDPWPGKKRAKRRLTHESKLRMYALLLKTCAPLLFKTDNRELFDFTLAELEKTGYSTTFVSRDLHANEPPGNIRTEYEQNFAAQGLPIFACTAERPQQGGGGAPCP